VNQKSPGSEKGVLFFVVFFYQKGALFLRAPEPPHATDRPDRPTDVID
jgi:hypothetical protein